MYNGGIVSESNELINIIHIYIVNTNVLTFCVLGIIYSVFLNLTQEETVNWTDLGLAL